MMGATQFKRAELEDQEIISHYFEHHTSRSCERTFCQCLSLVQTISGEVGNRTECTGIQK